MKQLHHLLYIITIAILYIPSSASYATADGYMIVTHDNFYNSVIPLQAMRQGEGFQTVVVKTSDIGPNPTAADIADYIRSESKRMRNLRYVLLVGDTDYIPTHTVQPCSTCGSTEPTPSDLYYATSNTNHYMPDWLVGRLPVNDTLEADILVGKILNYSPGASDEALIFGSYPEATYAVDDAILLENQEYIVDTVITDAPTTCADTAVTGAIIDSINDGKLLTTYYGHGTYSANNSLCSSHINMLTNTILPVMMSGGCDTNDFSHQKSLSENLLLHPTGGAIAFIGATHNGGYGYAYRFVDGFYSALSTSGKLGDMFEQGLLSAYQAAKDAGRPVGNDSWTKFFVERLTLLGDPGMSIEIVFTDEVCNDVIDNDMDGKTDCVDRDCRNDPACTGGGSEVCDDHVDNDDDGLIDCDDSDCNTACMPACFSHTDELSCTEAACRWNTKKAVCR